jgi:hypothetical protein
MGVTTAVFCLAGGIMSLAGGGLMALDIRLPFYIACAAAGVGLLVMPFSWRNERVRKLVDARAAAA